MHKLQKKYQKQIQQLVDTSVRLGELGFVTSHGGNLSCRADDNLVLITPTKVPKRDLEFDDIVLINMQGKVKFASHGRAPTGETPIHLNILCKRPDIKGLVHAHPPILTGFSLLKEELLAAPLLPEPIIEVGPVIYVNYEEPLSQKLAEAFDHVITQSNVFLMRNHGVMICSNENVWRALELLEMLENMAHSVFVAASIGSVTRIPLDEVQKLERTLRTRNLPLPGKPGCVTSLADAYRKKPQRSEKAS